VQPPVAAQAKPVDRPASVALAAPVAKAEPKLSTPKPAAPKLTPPKREPAVLAAPKAGQPAPAPAAAPQIAIAQPTTEGVKTMTDAINQTREAAQQTAEQIRSAMGNANEQSKAAMEKSARIVEELADLTRGNVEALVASSKTAAKYAETLTQGAADYGRRSFEQASTALKSFAEVKSPTDFFRLQSDYARSAFDQMVAESARVSETMVKMSGDVAEPITSRYSVAAERMKALAA
jgi:phasin family protein